MTTQDVIRIVSALVRPIAQRARLAVGRGIITLVDDAKKVQSVQVTLLAGEDHDNVESFGHYGFASHPEPDAECIAVATGGARSQIVVIATEDRRYRPRNLEEGEVVLYTLQNGTRVRLLPDGTIEIGTDASEYAARADRTEAEIKSLRDYTANHTHPATTTATVAMAGPATVSVSPPADPPPDVGSTASDEVKIK